MVNERNVEIEAAAFRRLVKHFQKRTDVQNIDLMILAGFCRNCLSRWYAEESTLLNCEVTEDKAREKIYGMPYKKWKEIFQTEASKEKIESLKNQETH